MLGSFTQKATLRFGIIFADGFSQGAYDFPSYALIPHHYNHHRHRHHDRKCSGASGVSILKWRGSLDDKMEVKWSFSTQI